MPAFAALPSRSARDLQAVVATFAGLMAAGSVVAGAWPLTSAAHSRPS